ncbi:MAG TPA: dodecin family protein [Thermoanaerobaculia bacterium]|nr:dodecin family protein [Thermoanaerobaculia bacterium]
MSVAKVTEITSESPESFEKAIQEGIARATKTLKNIKSAWVSEQHLSIDNDKIVGYRVNMKLVFLLEEPR